MSNIRTVKFVIEGYYKVDMAEAQENYDTIDPVEMLEIDRKNMLNYPAEMLEETDFTVELSWEN